MIHVYAKRWRLLWLLIFFCRIRRKWHEGAKVVEDMEEGRRLNTVLYIGVNMKM